MTHNAAVDVHPLRRGEETLWLSVSSAPEEVALAPPSFTDLVGGEERRDRRCHLIAVSEGRPVGRLTGTFLNPRLYFVREILSTRPGAFREVAQEFGRYLASEFAANDMEILSWERDDLAEMNAAFLDAGFRVGRRKIFVERDLAGFEPPKADPFDYTSLADVGERAFVDVMTRAAVGDPFEDVTSRDALTDFRELVEYAGETFDPRWWRIARVGRRTAGVVLPQRFPGPRNEGTLFYVGVLPEERGKGLGRALHAAGLGFLASAGVSRYIGSTDDRNEPMIRIFEANGCRRKGTQLFLKARLSSQ
jgi:RimJ/RimL family protein N-acetyltransferase